MRIQFLVAVLLLSAPAAASQDEPLIVITPTGNETPLSNSPGTVSIVTADEINRHGYTTVAEALRNIPGLSLARSGPRGQITSLFARGTNSNHTLVILDGIVLNDPSSPTGSFDFSMLSLNDIERIEVVRGPLSTLYGSAAVGSVIQLISKKPAQQASSEIMLAAGNNQHLETSFSTSGILQTFDYRLSLLHQQEDGETAIMQKFDYMNLGQAREDDGWKNTRLSVHLGWQLSTMTKLDLFAFGSKSDIEIDEFLHEDNDWRLFNKEKGFNLSLTHRPPGADWNASLALRYTENDRDSLNPRQRVTENLINTKYTGKRGQAEARLNFFGFSGHQLTTSASYTSSSLDSSGNMRFGSEYGDFVISQETTASDYNRSFALQDQWTSTNGISITTSLRGDSHKNFGTHGSYRLAANLPFSNNRGRLHLSAGTGFKAPTLYELYGLSPTNYGTAYRGNPRLQPEKSRSIEVGGEYALLGNFLNVGVTFYSTQISNLIETVYDTNFNSTSANIAQADIKGTELTFNWQPLKRLSLDLNYSYTDAYNNSSKQALVRRPKHSANLLIDFMASERLSMWAHLQYTGHYYDIHPMDFKQTSMPDFTLVHVGMNYRLDNDTTLFGRIDNLFDRDYEPVAGYRGESINGLVGIKLTF